MEKYIKRLWPAGVLLLFVAAIGSNPRMMQDLQINNALSIISTDPELMVEDSDGSRSLEIKAAGDSAYIQADNDSNGDALTLNLSTSQTTIKNLSVDTASLVVDSELTQAADSSGEGPFQFAVWTQQGGDQAYDTANQWFDDTVSGFSSANWRFAVDIPVELYGGTVVIDSVEIEGHTSDTALHLEYCRLIRNDGSGGLEVVDVDNTDYGNGSSGTFTVSTFPTAALTRDTGYPGWQLHLYWDNGSNFSSAEARIYKIIFECHLE